MNLKTWARTILTVQKYLDRICSSIDACIEKRVGVSSYVTSKNVAANSAECLADWIINMSERKVNLINLNVVCINALKNIDRGYAKILALKYFDNLPSKDIIEILNLSERTYFRKLNNAHVEFEDCLRRSGFDETFFSTLLKNEGWITEIYYETERMLSEQKKDSVITFNNVFLERICRAYK